MKFETKFKVLIPQDMPDGHGGYITSWSQLGYIWGHVTTSRKVGAALSGNSSERVESTIILRDSYGMTFAPGMLLHDGLKANEISQVSEGHSHIVTVQTAVKDFVDV